LRRLEGEEALVRARVAEPVELRAELLVQHRGHGVAPFGRRTILHASPDSRRANASSYRSSGSSAVMSGRRSTTPCSRSQRVVYHVSQISRPLTAVTVRFLKMSDSAMSIVAGRRGDPEEDDVAAVAARCRTHPRSP
jgi:hypothetical protein